MRDVIILNWCLILAAGCASSGTVPDGPAADPEVRKWIQALKSEQPEVYRLAERRLQELGLRALPYLTEQLGSPDSTLRERVPTVVFLIAAAHEDELNRLDPETERRVREVLENRFWKTLSKRTGSTMEWVKTFVPIRFPLVPHLRLYVKEYEVLGRPVKDTYLVNGLDMDLEMRSLHNVSGALSAAQVRCDSRSTAETMARTFVDMLATHPTESLKVYLRQELESGFTFYIEALPYCEVCVRSELRDTDPRNHEMENCSITLTLTRAGRLSFEKH